MPESRVNCLCGAISLHVSVTLPAKTELCHCNPCRLITGALFAGFAELPQAPDQSVLAKCTTYDSSKTHDRLFCSTCGSKVFVHAHHYPDGTERGLWCAYGGVVERMDGQECPNILEAETHEWVADTGDAGLAPYMSRLGDRKIEMYRQSQDDPPLSPTNIAKAPDASAPGPDDRLEAKCRCGQVSLLVKPADHTDKSISKLDRFIPFLPDGTKINTKYQARACVCRSCRLAMGVSLTTHTYIPPAQVLNPHTGKPLAFARALETADGKAANQGLENLKRHWSSTDACRSFCGTCGSTIFYWNEQRQDVVNIAAGILRAEEGAMAKRWFYWQPGMVSWKDEAVDREILDAYMAADVNA